MTRPGGNPDFSRIRNTDTTASIKQRQQNADDHARHMAEAVKEFMGDDGRLKPYRICTDWLNERGYTTRRGNRWTTREVSRLIKRITRPGVMASR